MKTNEASVGASDAKNRFSELLERVHHGAEVIITKHDRPVAKLVPVSGPKNQVRKQTTADLRALSKRYSLKGVAVRDPIEGGRR